MMEVNYFGGLGEGRAYDCCPCEFIEASLQPIDTSKTINKNFTERNNWLMENKNKRRYSNKDIRCVFEVKDSDIQ